MLRLSALAVVLALGASGCARGGAKFKELQLPGAASAPVRVAPDARLAGKVVRVNVGARFAVLNFPIGHLPALDQRLNVYRAGLKVGEIKVTGPQLDDNIVGDILAGDAQPGDEVRDR